MTNLLDGEWTGRPDAIVVTIPIPNGLFGPGTHREVVADFIAGVAARYAREEYLRQRDARG